jgi:hypothetical protein
MAIKVVKVSKVDKSVKVSKALMHVGTLRRGFEGGPRDTKAGNSRNVIMHVRALGKGSEKGSKSGGQQGSRAAGQ